MVAQALNSLFLKIPTVFYKKSCKENNVKILFKFFFYISNINGFFVCLVWSCNAIKCSFMSIFKSYFSNLKKKKYISKKSKNLSYRKSIKHINLPNYGRPSLSWTQRMSCMILLDNTLLQGQVSRNFMPRFSKKGRTFIWD
jgi:hypothetical protein